jgi:hypothetical protein
MDSVINAKTLSQSKKEIGITCYRSDLQTAKLRFFQYY